ncbi:MAG: Polysaccharide biosynthesis protein [Microgenomates group bacterium GW2011_GWA2_47_8]|nr:MAG: Polysaccharide biosynthesis protein [Microgenomates group bacterium GW2011_GWA2_47_8]
MSPTKWKVAWNTASQLLGKIAGSGAMLFVSILIARSFGAQGYGDFTKITTFVAFFYLLVDFGLNAVYLKRQTDWATLLGMRLMGGTILMFVAIAILSFLPQNENQGYTGLVRLGIILFTPTILIQGLIVSANAIFQKHLRYDLATVALTVGNIIAVVLVWSAVYGLSSRVGVIGVTTSLLLGLGGTAVVSLFFVRKIESPIHISFDRGVGKALFVAALPLGLTLLFNQVYFRVDSLVLTLTRSTTEVGLYGLAYKTFELPLVIPTFFMNSVYPLLLVEQTPNFKKILRKSFFVLLIISLLSLVVFWFAAPLLIYIRPEFAESTPLLRVLTLGLPFFFLSSLVMWALIALGKQIVLAGIYGSLMVVTIVLDILVIPKFGAIGAVWITVGSEALVLFISGVVLQRYLRNI